LAISGAFSVESGRFHKFLEFQIGEAHYLIIRTGSRLAPADPFRESAKTMKQGSSLGWLAVWAAALCASSGVNAQNLGLGAGSRPAQSDTSQTDRSGWKDEGSSPRSTQMSKRLGLTARRGAFDPKYFEARGRELQGQFYEIGGPIDTKRGNGANARSGTEIPAIQRKGGMQWIIWAGLAGVAGASAGAVGYLYMTKAHPSAPPPNHIVVTDRP
jgi:hypothetical protein